MVVMENVIQLTEELENTVDRLNSLKRKLELLQVSVLKNIDYLNPFDIKVYRKMVKEVEEELESLHIINSNITSIVHGCDEVLDQVEQQHNLAGSCYIVGEEIKLKTTFCEICNRLKFQIEALITTRGVKVFYVDANGQVGKAALETLTQLKAKYDIVVKMATPNREAIKSWVFDYIEKFEVDKKQDLKDILKDVKFKLEWNVILNNINCLELNK